MGLVFNSDSFSLEFKSNWIYFMIGLPILTCLVRIMVLLTVFTYDTPTFYSSKGQKDKAIISLK